MKHRACASRCEPQRRHLGMGSPKPSDGAPRFSRACRPRALTRRQGCRTSLRCGQRGSGILPLAHAGQAAGSRFHVHWAFMEGGNGILPLDATPPGPSRRVAKPSSPHSPTSASPRLCGRFCQRKWKPSFATFTGHHLPCESAGGGSPAETRRRGGMSHEAPRLRVSM